MSEKHAPPNVPGESVAPRPPSPKRIAELKAKLQGDVLLAYENQKLHSIISRLREYAGHKDMCAQMVWFRSDMDGETDDVKPPCDCGYDALAKEVGESK